MSMVPTGPGGLVPAGAGMVGVVGLEDVDASDLVMPRLNIEHTDGVFKNSLSGETFDTLNVVILGQIKQRVLWPPDIGDEDSKPLCKSYDFQTGHPGAEFPWSAAAFPEGSDTLPCASCPLKEWGSHPKDDNKPWCSEQHVFPVLLPDADGDFTAPALLTLQRSGLKNTKSYLSSFAQTKTPMFTCVTAIGLDQQRRGSNRFCVPTFAKGRATDNSEWGAYADQYLSIRGFLQTPRTKDDGEGDGAATSSTPASAPAGASTAPAAAERYETEDEIPF